jgi:hypothetical protein
MVISLPAVPTGLPSAEMTDESSSGRSSTTELVQPT